MRNVALDYKAYNLLAPTYMLGSYTTTPAYVQVDPMNEADAVAVISVGQVSGAPTSSSVVVTIIGSAIGGTDAGTVLATIQSPLVGTQPSSTVINPQIASQPVQINTGVYQYVKAKVVLTFNGGTAPSLSMGVVFLNRQTVGTVSNTASLA